MNNTFMIENILLTMMLLLTILYSAWIIILLFFRKPSYRNYSPAVSIIIPAHNEESYIRRTLESILQDTYPRKEIIVVDDGSDDNTPRILREFARRNIRTIRTNHVGKAEALNKGVSLASHKIIITLDADSEISKGSMAEIVKPLKDKSIGGVSGIIRARKNWNLLTWFQDYEYIMSSGWRYTTTNVDGNSVLPGFSAFRKSALRHAGGFGSDTLTEDFDIAIALKKSGYKTITINAASITTNVPQTFKDLIRQRLRWGHGTIQVVKKHASFIMNRKSGMLGRFTIPTQLYWYLHALVYMPIMTYMMFGWSKVAAANGYVSLEFFRYLLSIVSVYGIADLLFKVITQQYTATLMIVFSLLSFFLSFVYTLIVFAKVTRPNKKVILAYIFFFPYAFFSLSVLAVSFFQSIFSSTKRNRWS